MSNTLRFKMPLLDAAQAQKHVTINEALVRSDILSSRRVESRSLSQPPALPEDGNAYVVGIAAAGEWSGEEGSIALFLNGGWEFLSPWSGARFWVEDEHSEILFTNDEWIEASVAASNGAAATTGKVIEFDHDLAASTASVTPAVIPDKAIVLGVTGRVISEITGPASWSLGVSGSPDRYGSGYGLTTGAFAHGVTGQPQAYFGATDLVITSDGPAFTGGSIRLAVHCLSISPPQAA